MEIRQLKVAGAYEIIYDRYGDDRGSFQEIYSRHIQKFSWAGPLKTNVAQINCSVSHKNVVRGIHRAPFTKLCTCVSGRIWDAVIDLRVDSPTYLTWDGVWLDPENQRQVFVPAYCGHGFFSAEDNSILIYMQDGHYVPEGQPGSQQSWNYRDPTFGIKWPEADKYLLSEADGRARYYRS
tara:strand:- start:457 stop:996 length:540 start_codon:yes stop_codon:yes gene_type:complete